MEYIIVLSSLHREWASIVSKRFSTLWFTGDITNFGRWCNNPIPIYDNLCSSDKHNIDTISLTVVKISINNLRLCSINIG